MTCLAGVRAGNPSLRREAVDLSGDVQTSLPPSKRTTSCDPWSWTDRNFRERAPALFSAGSKPAPTHQSPKRPAADPNRRGASIHSTAISSGDHTDPHTSMRPAPTTPSRVAVRRNQIPCTARTKRARPSPPPRTGAASSWASPPRRKRPPRKWPRHHRSLTAPPPTRDPARTGANLSPDTHRSRGRGAKRPPPPFSRTDREEKSTRCRFVQRTENARPPRRLQRSSAPLLTALPSQPGALLPSATRRPRGPPLRSGTNP